jgi:hypothetical protein
MDELEMSRRERPGPLAQAAGAGLRDAIATLGTVVAIVLLVVLGIAIFLVHQYLWVIGVIFLIALGIGTIILVLAGVIWLVGMLRRAETIHIEQNGTVVRPLLGRPQLFAPLAPAGQKQIAAGKTDVSPVVPSVGELLAQNVLHVGMTGLLLGFYRNGQPRWGDWTDIRTFGCGGRGRMGKTVTIFFYIIQALLGGGVVWVCDPHFTKPTSLTALLGPLRKYIRVCGPDVEIVQCVRELAAEGEARRLGKSTMGGRPILLVIDEWTRIAKRMGEDGKYIASVIEQCAQEWAGYDMYAGLIGQAWTAEECGGTGLRRNLLAAICHQLDQDYSKFLLSAKFAKLTPDLGRGQMYLRDTDGKTEFLLEPLGVSKDAHTVVEMLEAAGMQSQLAGPGDLPELSPLHPARRLLPEQIAQHTYQRTIPLEQAERPPDEGEEPGNVIYMPRAGVSLPANDVSRVETAVEADRDMSMSAFPVSASSSPADESELEKAVSAVSLDIRETIKRMHKANIALRDVAKFVGLAGRKYDVFREICRQEGIHIGPSRTAEGE